MQILTGRQIYKQYKEYSQKELSLCGWVRSNRDSRDFGFLVITTELFLNNPDRIRQRTFKLY